MQRSRGTGPRATGQRGFQLHVGLWENLSLAVPRSRGTGPRATVKKRAAYRRAVGKPVPRRATLAGETRSDARVASEGPRATVKKTSPLTVGRGPVPRHATIAGDRPPHYGAICPIAINRAARSAVSAINREASATASSRDIGS